MAALLVVATHAAYLTGFTVNGGLLGRLAGRGDFGVAIFFALSGFLLHQHLVSDARDGRTDLKAYAVRRGARVLPAYWVTLAVVVALSQPPVRTTIAQALTIQTYARGTELDAFSQSWSIPTEVSFYIVLPVVVWLLGKVRHRHPDLPVVLLAGSAVVAVVRPRLACRSARSARTCSSSAGSRRAGRTSPSGWCSPRSCCGRPPVGRRRYGGWLVTRRAASCSPVPPSSSPPPPIAGPLTLGPVSGTQLSVRLALSTSVAGLLLAPLVLGRHDAYHAVLGSPVASSVGTVSYGLFLWHLPVFAGLYAVTGVEVFTGGILPLLALGLPISLLLAWLSHVAVERPAMRWAARTVPHRRAPLPR